jgi:DNA-binding NtrC family response regulator
MKINKIYIVEENLFYANLLQSRLERICTADVGIIESGLQLMALLPQLPPLVLLDRDLQSADSIEILKKIKGERPEVHVIILSGKENLYLAIDSLIHGATDYLIKGKNDMEEGLVELLEYCERNAANPFRNAEDLTY